MDKKSLLLVIILFLLFFSGGEKTEADTFNIAGAGGTVQYGTVTVSTNKASYSPGETVTVSGYVTFLPGRMIYTYLKAYVNNPNADVMVFNGVPFSGSAVLTAPATSGPFNVSFWTMMSPNYTMTYYNYPTTVALPLTPPTVQLYFSTLINKIKDLFIDPVLALTMN